MTVPVPEHPEAELTSPEMNLVQDLSLFSVLPDSPPIRKESSAESSVQPQNVKIDSLENKKLDNEKTLTTSQETTDNKEEIKPALTLIKGGAETNRDLKNPPQVNGYSFDAKTEFSEISKKNLSTSRENTKVNPFIKTFGLIGGFFVYMNENKGFYGSSGAAATSFFWRYQDLAATGTAGISLAAFIWLLILLLGNELDRLNKLAKEARRALIEELEESTEAIKTPNEKFAIKA